MKIRVKKKKQEVLGTDKNGPIFGFNGRNEPVCASKLRKRDAYCKCTIRVAPTGRCPKHGGHKKVGRPVTHGLWSNKMPGYLRGEFERSLLDPDFGTMRNSIAVLDALIADYLGGLSKIPSVETIQRVREQLEGLETTLAEDWDGWGKEQEKFFAKLLSDLRGVEKNRSEEREVRMAIRERAELVKAEATRIEKASKSLSVEQAMALVAAVAAVINLKVTNEIERQHITRAIATLVTEGSALPTGSEFPILEAEIVP